MTRWFSTRSPVRHKRVCKDSYFLPQETLFDHRNMEASGLALEFHQTAPLTPQIIQDFGKEILEIPVVKSGGIPLAMEACVGKIAEAT